MNGDQVMRKIGKNQMALTEEENCARSRNMYYQRGFCPLCERLEFEYLIKRHHEKQNLFFFFMRRNLGNAMVLHMRVYEPPRPERI